LISPVDPAANIAQILQPEPEMTIQTNAANIVAVSAAGQVRGKPVHVRASSLNPPFWMRCKAFLWRRSAAFVCIERVCRRQRLRLRSGDCAILPSVFRIPTPNKKPRLNVFACVGNEADIVSGAAKGPRLL